MVQYICRTCLYVSDTEFSFRKLDKVKSILELFIPEVKSLVQKESLVCEQCYSFLKTVNSFKQKCLATQEKLFAMNSSTISNKHSSILQTISRETCIVANKQLSLEKPASKPLAPHYSNILSAPYVKSKQKSTNKPNRKPSVIKGSSGHILKNLLNSSSREATEFYSCLGDVQLDTCLSQSAANIPSSIGNLYQQDLVSPTSITSSALSTSDQVKDGELIMNYEDDVMFIEEDDTSLTHSKSGPFNKRSSECKSKTTKTMMEVVDLSDNCDDSSLSKVESGLVDVQGTPLVYANCNKTDVPYVQLVSEIKQETVDVNEEEENPGFFNKQSKNGYYKCRLCLKQYKTSKGLYGHTVTNHKEVKIHHCSCCSFFTLWRSALMRHYSVFHGEVFNNGSNSSFKCSHCPFESRSKDQLSHHILNNHVYEKFTRCTFCRAQFSDSTCFAKHLQKEHLSLDIPHSSNYCKQCDTILTSRDDYKEHMERTHRKMVCGICFAALDTRGKLREHQFKTHTTSFGASVLP